MHLSDSTPHAFRIATTGEHLRALITIRAKNVERQRALIATAVVSVKEQLGELEKVAEASVAAVRHRVDRAGRLPLGAFDNSVSTGVSEITELRARLLRMEEADALLGVQLAQGAWLRETLVPTHTYELDTRDLLLMGLGHDPAGDRDIAGLLTNRY